MKSIARSALGSILLSLLSINAAYADKESEQSKLEDAVTVSEDSQTNRDNINEFTSRNRVFSRNFDQELEKLIYDFNNNIFTMIPDFSGLRPGTDILSGDKEYQIILELPGMEEKDIGVKLQDHNLIIEGERKSDRQASDINLEKRERSYGSFKRVFALPQNVDEDSIEAKMKNGLLTIKILKKQVPEEQARIIKINK